MKNMNVQSLSLMMLISMAYAASITISQRRARQEALLKDINADVKEANKTLNDVKVHMEEPKQGHICEKCFFHYARDALKGLNENSLQNLTRRLDKYISSTKFQNHHDCPTREKIEIRLHRLLNETHQCVCKALRVMDL